MRKEIRILRSTFTFQGDLCWISLNIWHSFWFTFRFCLFNKFQVDFMYEGMITHVTVLNFASIPTMELVSVPQQLSPFR